MFAYGPSDLDPTIRTYPDLDLISRVNFGSGGSGIWARGAAALLAGAELRGGASPEEAIPAFPWPIQAAVWRWSRPVARANHPGGLCGSAMGAVVRTAKRGGSVAARFIGVRVGARYRLDLGCYGSRAHTQSMAPLLEALARLWHSGTWLATASWPGGSPASGASRGQGSTGV